MCETNNLELGTDVAFEDIINIIHYSIKSMTTGVRKWKKKHAMLCL